MQLLGLQHKRTTFCSGSDQGFKGKGLGGALLADALARACNTEIAAFALVVDVKDQAAADFYLHHGFIAFVATPLMLSLPLVTVKTQIENDRQKTD